MHLRHPFERLSNRGLRLWCIWVFVGWAALSVIGFASIPTQHFTDAMRMAGAPSADPGRWSTEVRISVAYLIGSDYLYDILHNNAVGLLAVLGARLLGHAQVTWVARGIAWTMWLDTVLNVIENLAFLAAVRGRRDWLEVAQPIEAFRTSTLLLGLVFGVTTLCFVWWRRRR